MALNIDNNTSDTMVLNGVLEVLESNKNWLGTMTQLRSAITKNLSKTQREMITKSPSYLRIVLNRITNRLRSRGVSVKFKRNNERRFVSFSKN